MKAFALSATLLAAVALAPVAHADVTAADLGARCTASRAVCETSVKWIEDNTSACIRTGVTPKQAVDRVIRWLVRHPAQKGRDDNDVTGAAVSALWPCR